MTRNSIKTLERVYKHYYFIIRARSAESEKEVLELDQK